MTTLQIRFNDWQLKFGPGECWCILGANGCGKTTLLHQLAGLLPHANVSIDEKPLSQYSPRARAQWIGLLFQDATYPSNQTVLDYCYAARFAYSSFFQKQSTADFAIITEALAQVALTDKMHSPLQKLSGGEKRRAAIASLLAQAPAFYLLDEPTNHLDMRHQLIVLTHLKRLATAGQTIIMTLHDVQLAQVFCTHALMLLPNGTVLQGPKDTLFTSKNLTALYQHPMVNIQNGDQVIWQPVY